MKVGGLKDKKDGRAVVRSLVCVKAAVVCLRSKSGGLAV